MSDKKCKYNFTPKNKISKKKNKKPNQNMQDELKRNLYQNDLRKMKQINKFTDNKNNALTDIITNTNDDNLVTNESSNVSQILTNYLEGIQKTKSNIIKQSQFKVEENSDLDEYINNDKDNIDDDIEEYKNTSELNYLISTNKKENIDFINTFLKLKGINSDKKIKNLKENYNSNKILKKESKHSEQNNQKKIFVDKIANNKNKIIKDNSDEIYEYEYNAKNLTEENKYLKRYSPDLEMLKKTYEKNKSICKKNNKSKYNYINKTLSSKKKKCIKKVTINLMDTEEPTIQIYNSNSKNKRRKSFDKKSYRKTSENKKNNNKKTFKTKSHNKSPIFNNNKIFKAKTVRKNKSNNSIEIFIINDNSINKKNSFKDKKYENEKYKKNSGDDIKVKNNNENKNKNIKRGKSKDNSCDKDKKENKKENKKEIKKPFKMLNNLYKKQYKNFNTNNIKKNYDLNKLKIQNHKFSVIDELDEEIKGDTIQDNNMKLYIIKKEYKTKNNSKNKNNSKDKDKNENKKENNNINGDNNNINNSPYERNQNNNKNALKNNISSISNDTFCNEIGFTDKKLLTSFFSTSTFNNDLVNYKPTEKSSSNFITNNINNNNTINDNNTNTNFSIINNSSINPKLNNGNPNTNNTIITETNNNSKLNEKLSDSVSDVIHLKPEKEENINFLIETNSKVINEIDSNDISDIMPLENKDMALDYKINVYNNNNNESNNNHKANNNNISKEISSNEDEEEGESVIDHFDIINNQIQNESKEIKLSEIKNKEIMNDNINNNISNSNVNISITNLSKLTNFADSNIKLGEMSHISSKTNLKNSDIKKSNMKEIIEEPEQNTDNNNINKNEFNNKTETNIKRIVHKKVKKNKKGGDKRIYINNDIHNNNLGKEVDNIYINTEENNNNNYFFINSNKKNDNNEKNNTNDSENDSEPKDTVRKDEPTDNYRNKTKNLLFNYKEHKQRFNSTNMLNNNIFEDEDLNPTYKLVNTNKKDIVEINNVILNNIEKKKIKTISLNRNNNSAILSEKQTQSSPCTFKYNNKYKNEKQNTFINNNTMEFNNIRRIDRNNNINIKRKTFQIDENKYLINIPKVNNPRKSSNFINNLTPSPQHTNYTNYDNSLSTNNTTKEITGGKIIINSMNINNNNIDKISNNNQLNRLYKKKDFYFNNNQLLYKTNNFHTNNNGIMNLNEDEEIMKCYSKTNQLSPRVMNINNIYRINEPYNIYIQ